MLKKLCFFVFPLVALLGCSSHIAQAEFERFEHEELLLRLYAAVDVSDCPRILMQQMAFEWLQWCSEMTNQLETKEDMIYMNRMAHVFGEVFVSYHHGN